MNAPHQLIDAFLRQHPGFICTDCLARAVNVPPSQVSMVTHRLRSDAAFSSKIDVCSRCRAERTVIKAA